MNCRPFRILDYALTNHAADVLGADVEDLNLNPSKAISRLERWLPPCTRRQLLWPGEVEWPDNDGPQLGALGVFELHHATGERVWRSLTNIKDAIDTPDVVDWPTPFKDMYCEFWELRGQSRSRSDFYLKYVPLILLVHVSLLTTVCVSAMSSILPHPSSKQRLRTTSGTRNTPHMYTIRLKKRRTALGRTTTTRRIGTSCSDIPKRHGTTCGAMLATWRRLTELARRTWFSVSTYNRPAKSPLLAKSPLHPSHSSSMALGKRVLLRHPGNPCRTTPSKHHGRHRAPSSIKSAS